MEINIDKIKKIHFIGIGGIGISAIARLFKYYNKEVSGSDQSVSLITQTLKDLGVKINIGHEASNIEDDIDLVVYTIAIPKDNPELIEAQKKNIQTITYPQMLSVVSKNLFTIAISGTHGKTTTTAMVAKILMDSNFDPTVIVGSLIKDFKSNLVVGQGKYFVVEACEYRRSFLNLYPKILIITNIDTDHLDYYKDLADIQSAFRELAEKVPQDGVIVCNKTHPNVLPVIKDLDCKIVDYKELQDLDIKLKIPGVHNKENAMASISVSNFLNIETSSAIKSLSEFNGTWRRFDFKGVTKNGVFIYDDYAHHPKEIEMTIKGCREKYGNKKLVAIFEPHQFSRTKLLFDQFAESLDLADLVYLTPIYPARESFDPTINSEMLTDKIGQKASVLETKEDIVKKIEELKDCVVIFFGAGNIYKISEMLDLSV